jgi:hypothetical protein
LSNLHVEAGPNVSTSEKLSNHVQRALHDYYNYNGDKRVHYALDREPPRGSYELNQKAQFYEYALLGGRRIVPSTRSRRKNAGSSLVKVIWENRSYAGIVDRIFRHHQRGIDVDDLWAEMRWMVRRDESPVEDDIWVK